MDQPYMLDQVDPKQTPGPQMRRGYFGDDHDIYRQTNSLDLKYPFPQTHLYPPSSSVRGGPIKNPGQFPQDNQGGQEGHGHVNDPRYVPQEFASSVRDMDEKRFKGHYGYPSAQAPGQNIMNNGLNPASGINMYNTSGAGATPFNGMMIPPPVASGQPKAKENNGLVPPIPPLHVQHEISRKEQPELNPNSPDAIHSKCSRCKKDFVQRLVSPQETGKGKSTEPKIFKLCFHCRDLQRQRSRRWQKKTKDKEGACRRCGSEIPVDQQRFVLCPQCRKSLRIRKANRAAQGRCVHCSGPITSSIKDDSPDGESSEDPESRRSSVAGSFKVCQRCRENDKIRRTNLERMGNCNRCAKALTPEDQGKHKVCFTCRQKKKKGNSAGFGTEGTNEAENALPPPVPMAQSSSSVQGSQHRQGPHQLQSTPGIHGHNGQPGQPGPHMSEMPQNVLVPSMNYVPMDQNTMLVHPGMPGYGGVGMSMPQQEMPMGYGQQIQQMQPMLQGSGEMYKPPMTQLPQLQPHMDQGYQQYIGYPPVNRNGLHYSNSRM